MAYSKTSVSIQILYSRSKYQRISPLIKVFFKCVKAFLALRVRKSVSKQLTITKSGFLAFIKPDFFAKFITVDRFSIFSLIPLPLVLPPTLSAVLGMLWFVLFSLAWVLGSLSLVV